MADKIPRKNPEVDEYELLPHREIEELKQELAKLKEFEIAPSKKLHVSLLELNHKLDKLITIFEDATHELRVEEGGLSFTDKMKPLLGKMNKILEQNAEIASGILALADMVQGKKPEEASLDMKPPVADLSLPAAAPPGLPPMPSPAMAAPAPMSAPAPMEMPPPAAAPPPGMPPPPAPSLAERAEGKQVPGVPSGEPLPPFPKKRTFGL